MAQEPHKPGGEDANFVRAIVTDPKNVPDVMLLYGYPGASSEENHERLYLSPDLTNFIEVPKDAILHRATAPKEQDPHGGVTLWVKKDAALQYKMAPAAEALAHFFAGAIQGGAQAAAAAGPRPTPAVTALCGFTHHANCPTRGLHCQTHGATCGCSDLVCQTEITPCINTHANTCNCHPTQFCQTQGGDCTWIGCGHSLACTQGLLCQPAVAAGPGPGLTVGGPQCGVTLPNMCPILSANCTVVAPCPTHAHSCHPQATCGIDCTVAGPLCNTGGCTHITPCMITRAATCPPQATCGIDCTVVGPLCHTHPPQATCAHGCTHVTPCLMTHAATCPPQVSCGVDCTVIGPVCQTHHVSCAPLCTQICTQIAICLPTRNEPQCPFPTEVTCAPVCQASPAPACGPHITIGGCGGSLACVPGGGQPQQAAMAQGPCIGGTVVAEPFTRFCSVGCPTWHVTCNIACWSHRTPCCPIPTVQGHTCAAWCQVSPFCPMQTGVVCPPVSLACPQNSIACGQSLGCGPIGGGMPQAEAFAARAWTAWCGTMAACGSVNCTGNMCNTPAHPCTPHCPQ